MKVSAELAHRIRARELSPVEIVDAYIERIEARNTSLNAFVCFGFDDAREEARMAEKALTSDVELGVLHGVPTAIKDLFDFKPGWKSTFWGSAAAVADGLLPFAEGTDGGGSIRIPASWCGVYGYKASFGRIPFLARPNAFSGDIPFLTEGQISHTVEDAALAMTALSGYDHRDPLSIDEDVDFLSAT